VIDGELTETALERIADPAVLLELVWRLEPLGRYAERAAVLDRLAALLQAGPVPDAPPDRDWRCELWAERSIDAGRERRLVALRRHQAAEHVRGGTTRGPRPPSRAG
jgi:AcrR family transcriptional regulator